MTESVQRQLNPTCDGDPATDSNPVPELDAILDQLPTDRIRFLIARTDCDTNKDAARAVGLTEAAVKSWPKEHKDLIEQARLLMAKDGVITAMHLRRRNLAKAMAVKVRGLDSPDERVRQGAATEIIEWEMGRAVQRGELSGKDGGPLAFEDVGADANSRDRALSALAAAIAGTLHTGDSDGDGAMGSGE
jgi:hypothetical protein